MRWLRYLLRTIAGLAGLLALVLTVAYFWLSAPESPPPRNPVASQSGYALDAKVGEYLLPDGDFAVLTYSAHGGLQLYRLAGLRFTGADYLGHFKPVDGDRFTWRARDGAFERSVTFQSTRGRALSFSWQGTGGETRVATRVQDSPVRLGEVDFPGRDIRLSATVLLPSSPGPHAGVAMIHGSGDSDRDNLWYLHVAWQLARGGIAVLLPDKRGTGKSGGEWRSASFQDLAGDALDSLDALSALPGVDRRRVGLLGISQGGSWVAPLAAADSEIVRFVVNLSGAAVTPDEQIRHETRQNLRRQGVPAWLDWALVPYAAAIPQRRRDTWWTKNGDFDPVPYWRRLDRPALVIYGREDEADNVPVAESVARLHALDSPHITVRVFEDTGHALLEADEPRLRRDILEFLVDWIRRHAGR